MAPSTSSMSVGQADRQDARRPQMNRLSAGRLLTSGMLIVLTLGWLMSLTQPGEVGAAPSAVSTGWKITVYYTAVESLHNGTPTPVTGCTTISCSRGSAALGTYPQDFVQAVKAEGTGRITSGAYAGKYLNWSYDTGYWLDSAPRDAYGDALIPYVSAAADTLARGTAFSVLECGTDEGSGDTIDGAFCQRLKAASWRIVDEFTPGLGGANHADLYIGEEDSANFMKSSPKVISTAGAVLNIGGGGTPAPSPSPAPSPTPTATPSPTPAPGGPGPAETHTLTVTQQGQGTVSSGSATYSAGTTVTQRAKAANGWVLSSWMVDGSVRYGLNLTVRMDRDHQVVARFVKGQRYADVPAGYPAAEAIAQLAAAGIVRGYADGRFGPEDTTLRAQIAGLVVRATGWDGEDWGNTFADRGDVDGDLWRNVGTLAHYGVARGYADGTFQPTTAVNRVQVISLITRAMVAKGEWQLRSDDGTRYPNIPASSGHRQDLATYVAYAGPLPDTTTTAAYGGWDQPADRAWVARVLWAALNR